MNALEIAGLTKNYENFKLDHISFSVPKGIIMGLIGENGAGKSTTFKAALNLIKKDEGTVKFYGKSLDEDASLKEKIGVVFDGNHFYETLTPKQVGAISAAAYKNWDMTAYESYLKNFMLDENKEIKKFSKGMQVKLNLAVALSHHAQILILDEATSGLDPVVRDDILDIFLEFIQDENHAILMASHITSDLEKIADYITFIHQGKVLLSTTKDELIDEYGVLKCKKAFFETMDPADRLAYRKGDYQYEVLVKNRKQIARKYKDAVIDPATLDEIMMLYVKGER